MAGNAKGVVAAALSVMLFQNPVSVMTSLGYAITVAGVAAYSQQAAAIWPSFQEQQSS
jgi:hypothetical protein